VPYKTLVLKLGQVKRKISKLPKMHLLKELKLTVMPNKVNMQVVEVLLLKNLCLLLTTNIDDDFFT